MQPQIAQFDNEIIQAQREALQALREILVQAAQPPDFRGSIVNTDISRHLAATARRLSLRLRAAVTILRMRPAAALRTANGTPAPALFRATLPADARKIVDDARAAVARLRESSGSLQSAKTG